MKYPVCVKDAYQYKIGPHEVCSFSFSGLSQEEVMIVSGQNLVN